MPRNIRNTRVGIGLTPLEEKRLATTTDFDRTLRGVVQRGGTKRRMIMRTWSRLMSRLDEWSVRWSEHRIDAALRHDSGAAGQAIRGVQPGRCHDRSALRGHWARAHHHPLARA